MRSFPVALDPDPKAEAIERAVLEEAFQDLRGLIESYRAFGRIRDGEIVLRLKLAGGRARGHTTTLEQSDGRPDRKSGS